MDEYIKKSYAVDAVLDVYYDTPDIDLSGEKFEAAIFKIPPADVAPVWHGRWLGWGKSGTPTYENYGTCSVCGEDAEIYTEHRNYCPNCGAKMDGGDGNSDMA